MSWALFLGALFWARNSERDFCRRFATRFELQEFWTMRVKSVLARSVLAKSAVTLAVLMPLLAASPVSSADLTTPAGLWQAVDDNTKQPTGWFIINNHDGVYSGFIAKMFMKPGEAPNPVCDKCTDDRQNHPWLGLEIIRDMKQEEADKYGGGSILDPRDGKVYHAIMKLSPDGQTLTVRGYLGFEMLGKNVYWTRLPDSAYSMLDPSINPNTAVKRAPGVPGTAPAPMMAPQQHKSELPRPQNALGLRQ
jgi:uncharacterized protein (DUF2147 family)